MSSIVRALTSRHPVFKGWHMEGVTATETGDISPRIAARLLLLVLILAGAWRLFFSDGLQNGDASLYAEEAHNLATGQLPLPRTAYSVRYGLIVPVAISFKLFGVNDTSLTLFPLFCSLATITVCYRIGILVSGRRMALIAASLLACLPLDILQSSDLHADLPISMWLALTLWLFVASVRATAHHRFYFALAGLCFGFAYLTKLTCLAFCPALLALIVYYRPLRHSAWAGMVFLVVILVESACYWAVTGNPLHRLTAELAGGMHGESIRRMYPDAARNLWLAFFEIPGLLFLPYPFAHDPYFAFHFILLPISLLWAIRRKAIACYPLVIWLVLLYIPTSFGTVNIRTFAPAQVREPRVLEPLCVPAMLLIAVFLVSLKPRVWIVPSIAAMIIYAILCTFVCDFETRQEFGPLKRVYAFANVDGACHESMYADPWTIHCLRYLDHYEHPTLIQSYPPQRAEGRLIIRRSTLQTIKRLNDYDVPSWVMELRMTTPVLVAHAYEQVRGGYRHRVAQRKTLFEIVWAVQPTEDRDVQLYSKRH